jgi:hypothetical protein
MDTGWEEDATARDVGNELGIVVVVSEERG